MRSRQISAIGGDDIRPSPFSENFPGVEYHAAFIENILTQKFAQRTLVTALLEPLLILVLTVVYAFAFGRLSPVWSSFCLIVSLFLDHVRDFAQALAFYRYGNFADARQDFLALAAKPLQDYRDELSEMFAARCQDFLDASLKDRWDGVWLMSAPSKGHVNQRV